MQTFFGIEPRKHAKEKKLWDFKINLAQRMFDQVWTLENGRQSNPIRRYNQTLLT